MPVVHFLGAILPKCSGLNITELKPVRFIRDGTTDQHVELTITVMDSIVDVECKLSRYEDADFGTIYQHVFELSRAFIDLAAFSQGVGLTVAFETFIGPTGIPKTFMIGDAALTGLCTTFKLQPDADLLTVIGLVMKEPPLFMALNDLTSTLELPQHHLYANCARAVERIRHQIAPGLSKASAWGILRSSLNATQEYLDVIMERSHGPRHGESHPAGPDAKETRRRAWVIMNRFLEFRKRGSAALPIAEFPMLK